MVTISLLRFGELVGGLKATKYEVNIDDEHLKIDKLNILQNELAKLKSEANYGSMLPNESLSISFNADRFAHIERTVCDYLQDKVTELTILNVCEINTALEILKSLCTKYEKQNKANNSASLMKTKTVSSSNNKILYSKSSRLSTKMSSTNNNLTRKTSEENLRLHAAVLKPSKSKIQSVQTLRSQRESKINSYNLVTGKRNSHLNVSEEGLKHYSIPIEIQTEFSEAWNMYKIEKKDVYEDLMKSYEKAATNAKILYKSYLNEVEQLKEMAMSVNKIKNDLLLAQMTRQLQNMENYTVSSNDLEKCYIAQLKKSEKEQCQKRETVLSSQAMLKVSLNICKQLEQDLKDNFDLYCREKYQMPIYAEVSDEELNLKNPTENITEERNEMNILSPDQSSMEKFNQLKALIAAEQKKKKMYQSKQREWSFY